MRKFIVYVATNIHVPKRGYPVLLEDNPRNQQPVVEATTTATYPGKMNEDV
jgi:hypothetical protein